MPAWERLDQIRWSQKSATKSRRPFRRQRSDRHTERFDSSCFSPSSHRRIATRKKGPHNKRERKLPLSAFQRLDDVPAKMFLPTGGDRSMSGDFSARPPPQRRQATPCLAGLLCDHQYTTFTVQSPNPSRTIQLRKLFGLWPSAVAQNPTRQAPEMISSIFQPNLAKRSDPSAGYPSRRIRFRERWGLVSTPETQPDARAGGFRCLIRRTLHIRIARLDDGGRIWTAMRLAHAA